MLDFVVGVKKNFYGCYYEYYKRNSFELTFKSAELSVDGLQKYKSLPFTAKPKMARNGSVEGPF